MNMNFADKINMHFAAKAKDESLTASKKLEVAGEAFENWKKPLSIKDVSDTIFEVCKEVAEATGDQTIFLEGLYISLKLTDKLFPKEEFDEYLKAKGEE